MKKKFRVTDAEGRNQIVEADSVEFQKRKKGLNIEFRIGPKTKIKISGAVALIEMQQPVDPKPIQKRENDEDSFLPQPVNQIDASAAEDDDFVPQHSPYAQGKGPMVD